MLKVATSLAMCLFLALTSTVHAQVTVQTGPEITSISGSDAVISIELSSEAPAEIHYWTDPARGIQILRRPSNKKHNFSIPATPVQYYRVVVKNSDATADVLTTPQFSTQSANLPAAVVAIGNPTVIHGNILNIPINATRSSELAISWVSALGSSSTTRSIDPGSKPIQVDLPAPTSGNGIVKVTLRATSSGQVVAERPAEDHITSPSTANFAVGGGTVTPSLTGATFNVSVTSPVLSSISYELMLKDSLSFSRPVTGTCQIPTCTIQINGLLPNKKFTYELRFIAGGKTIPYTSSALAEFMTLSHPALVGGPKLEFTSTGFRVLATTTRDANVELVYRAIDGSTVTSLQTATGTNHAIPVTQGFVFDSTGNAETTLQLVVKTPGTGAEVSRHPFAFRMATAPVTTPNQARRLGDRKIKDIVRTFGPAAMAFLGVPAPLVQALTQ